ncbi:VWA domain-containing protein [Herbaspirillum sp. HC18]|nr:VWA domain-containing protein [Herbaspirillum sp. HC18]
MIPFTRPWWLLALLPLAFTAWRCWRSPAGMTPWQRVVDAHLLPHLLTESTPSSRRALALLSVAGWTCAVLALAGPMRDGAMQRQATGRDSIRVLVVDLSEEAAPQLDRIKLKLHALLHAFTGGETALLVYADEPYLVVPPTSDTQVIARFIPELAPDAMPANGNHPERALRMASALLERSRTSARDIVWITGNPSRFAPPASGFKDLRFSVLHAGKEGEPILRTTVEHTGGILVSMRSDDTDVKTLADAMTQGKPTTADHAGDGVDVGYWLLLPLLPLAAWHFRRGVLAVLPLALFLGMLPPPAEAALFNNAQRQAAAHYRAGRFEDAARLLDGIDEPDAHYNRGNALAKLGHLGEALAAYESSLRLRPGDGDTVYNRDLVKRLLNGNSNSNSTDSQGDAARAAGQWLRGVPDDPGSLLRRKLQIEHERRRTGTAERPW